MTLHVCRCCRLGFVERALLSLASKRKPSRSCRLTEPFERFAYWTITSAWLLLVSSRSGRSEEGCEIHCYIVGLTADARILIDKARIECQSHKLTVEDPVTMEYIARFLASIMQVFCCSLLYHSFVTDCSCGIFEA